MRNKTARLIRASCNMTGYPYRKAKKEWNKIPRNKRREEKDIMIWELSK